MTARYIIRVDIPLLASDNDDPWHEEITVDAIGATEARAKAKKIIRKRFRVTGVTATVISANYGDSAQ